MEFYRAGENAKKLFEFQITEEISTIIQEEYKEILPYRETED